jgi:hypothetical protein
MAAIKKAVKGAHWEPQLVGGFSHLNTQPTSHQRSFYLKNFPPTHLTLKVLICKVSKCTLYSCSYCLKVE